jgi:hypothetical protein
MQTKRTMVIAMLLAGIVLFLAPTVAVARTSGHKQWNFTTPAPADSIRVPASVESDYSAGRTSFGSFKTDVTACLHSSNSYSTTLLRDRSFYPDQDVADLFNIRFCRGPAERDLLRWDSGRFHSDVHKFGDDLGGARRAGWNYVLWFN